MKRILFILMSIVLVVTLVSCKGTNKDNEITVGYAFEPVKTILNMIQEDVLEDGYTLKIVEMGLAANNLALKDNELDANLIQHKLYLNNFNKANKSDLTIAFNLYHAIYSLYSSEVEKVSDIPNNTLITLPDDEANRTRAFYLLSQAELISFEDSSKAILTEDDITNNPKELKFEYVSVDSIAQRYVETKYAVMYPTYARSLELVGDEQRLYVEVLDEVTKEYAISLAVRKDDLNSDLINILIKHLSSDKIRDYLTEHYGWANVPAF